MEPVLLTILDGWGFAESNESNPFNVAQTPTLDYLFNTYPSTKLNASGEYVGLPLGQMGNSEVGHMSIGSGRVIVQDLPKISSSMQEGILEDHFLLKGFLNKVKNLNGKCHIMGLLSDGGVHSHIEHFIWIADFFARNKCKVYLHIFLDGRDSSVISRGKYVQQLLDTIKNYSNIGLATICGRYYAMDRDKRWERTELAFKAIFKGEGLKFANWDLCFKYHYEREITDEFFMPSVIGSFKKINNNDAIIMVNFRADRVRQLLEAALIEEFKGFRIDNKPQTFALGMTNYSQDLSQRMTILFKNEKLNNILGEILEKNGLLQLRISETEKYAHVTFFFNSGREEAFKGEDRILVNSPLVATYDLKPEMSSFEITDNLISKLPYYNFILLNFANMDMVGHTGNFKAAVKAIEAVDKCLGKIISKLREVNGHMILTSDHGNIEIMEEANGLIHTQHTTNLVPLILFSEKFKNTKLSEGNLTDIAPTILTLLNLETPSEMTGNSLINLEKV